MSKPQWVWNGITLCAIIAMVIIPVVALKIGGNDHVVELMQIIFPVWLTILVIILIVSAAVNLWMYIKPQAAAPPAATPPTPTPPAGT